VYSAGGIEALHCTVGRVQYVLLLYSCSYRTVLSCPVLLLYSYVAVGERQKRTRRQGPEVRAAQVLSLALDLRDCRCARRGDLCLYVGDWMGLCYDPSPIAVVGIDLVD
jgi:hypothetical protein